MRLRSISTHVRPAMGLHFGMFPRLGFIPRNLVGEKMDSPTLGEADHQAALAGLRRINRVSRTARSLFAPLRAFASKANLKNIRLLDVASGGGDVPVALAVLARAAGISIDLTFFDFSESALRVARAEASRKNLNPKTIVGDATRDVLRDVGAEAFDVVTSSLFLHHLTEPDTIAVLAGMKRATAGLLLVSDLRRSRIGLVLAHVACRALSRSPVVHFDGPASVRAAWTNDELADLASRAGLDGAVIRTNWPARMLLGWERHNGVSE